MQTWSKPAAGLSRSAGPRTTRCQACELPAGLQPRFPTPLSQSHPNNPSTAAEPPSPLVGGKARYAPLSAAELHGSGRHRAADLELRTAVPGSCPDPFRIFQTSALVPFRFEIRLFVLILKRQHSAFFAPQLLFLLAACISLQGFTFLNTSSHSGLCWERGLAQDQSFLPAPSSALFHQSQM